MPRHMWDFTPPTRDWTCAPYIGSAVLTTGPPGSPPEWFEMVLGYAGRKNWRVRNCRPLLLPCVHVCRIIYSLSKPLLNTSDGLSPLLGLWEYSHAQILGITLPFPLNCDPDWPLLYSSLAEALTSGQLLQFAPESLVVSWLLVTSWNVWPFQDYTTSCCAWGTAHWQAQTQTLAMP